MVWYGSTYLAPNPGLGDRYADTKLPAMPDTIYVVKNRPGPNNFSKSGPNRFREIILVAKWSGLACNHTGDSKRYNSCPCWIKSDRLTPHVVTEGRQTCNAYRMTLVHTIRNVQDDLELRLSFRRRRVAKLA
jgi:hypothetical protein